MMSTMELADGPHTLGRWVGDSALRQPDRPAIVAGTEVVTYRELDERAPRLAGVLLRAGCVPGDRIATLTGNSADQVVLFFACARARLVLGPLSWRLCARELAWPLCD